MLIRHDLHLLPLPRHAQHSQEKILPRSPINPARPQRHSFRPARRQSLLSRQLGSPINPQRPRLIVLSVRRRPLPRNT